MAAYFWVAKYSSWSGPTGAGTEASPFLGALALRNAFGGTISSAGGHVITFMGEYGPVTVQEINEDFANQNKTITQQLTSQWPYAGPGATCQGGIIFGTSGGNASNCKDNTFRFRGDPATIPYHIDARGATTNAGRMQAALIIQGNRNRVEGIRIAQPNWDWIGGGSGRVPATVISAASLLAHESSFENFGLLMLGWGCQIDSGTTEGYETEALSWGSNAFGRASFRIELSMLDAPANSGSSLTYIQNTYSYGMADGPQIHFNGGQVNGGLAYPMRLMPEAGARAYIRWNRVGELRWGDTATSPAINNASQHGNHLNMLSGYWERGDARIYGNETWGFCQDSIEVIGANHKIHDNWIHDLTPTFSDGQTILYWTNTASAWAQVSGGVVGSGIKLGLGGSNGGSEGELTGTVWPSLGVASVSGYLTAAFRNQAFRNLCENNTQDVIAGISTNGSNGCIISSNEVINFGRGIFINRTSAPATEVKAHWVTNNYCRVRNAGLQQSSYTVLWMYNNIFNATTDYNCAGSTNHTIIGANNRFVNNTTNLGTGIVNLMTGTTTGAADYTEKVGPTSGGNCAAAGSLAGLLDARASCVLKDMRGRPWGNGAIPVGPYKL